MKTSMLLRVALAILLAGTAVWPATAQQRRLSPAAQAVVDAQQAAPTRPQNGQPTTEPIQVNFPDTELLHIVDMLTAQIGGNFLLPPGNVLNIKVALFASEPIPAELAYEFLESLLAMHNFSLVETLDGNLIKIVQAGENPEKLNIERGNAPPEVGFDNYTIRVVSVEYAAVDEVATLLAEVGSKATGADIKVWNSTNMLIIRDTAEAMRNMLELLEIIDIPGNQVVMEIFNLQYERAETIQQFVQDVLSDDAAGGGGARSAATPRVATRVQRATVPGKAAPTQVGSRENVLRMVPNERLNALIVVASEPMMVQVRDLVDQIDTPTPYEENTIHYVELRNADAEEVATALEGLTGLAPRQGGAEGGGGGGAQTAQVQPFEKEISITQYEATNSLIIVATPQDFRRLELLISNIDVPIRQVNVEAIIMEVSINDKFELGVELLGLTGNDAFGLNNVANLTNAILGGPLALAGPGATFGILDGTTEIPVPGLPDSTGATGGVTLQTIPNVPLLLKALETVTDVEVLSQPNLLTRDNEESTITVGQDIPIVSSLQDNFRGGQSTGFQGFAGRGSVQRQRVGVIMTVTPQINEGDYVSMEVTVEVSEPVESTVGISDQSQGGATINLTEVVNNVVIPDGSTGIIGGLLREGKNRTTSGAPGLSDIPMLGWLFRNKVNARSKQNLVILLTPHIIKEAQDLERVTEFRMDEFYDRNVDVIFEKEMFFKKLRKKHEIRNNYNPTKRFNNPKGVRRGFGRGDIGN